MRILLVEDEDRIASFVVKGLQAEGHTVERGGHSRRGAPAGRSNARTTSCCSTCCCPTGTVATCSPHCARTTRHPVIVLSALGEVDDKVALLDNGANDYLTKPFAMRELSARVRAHARHGQAVSHGSLTAETSSSTPARASPSTATSAADLPSREYALLEYLMRHAGQVLTRQQLLDAVWGFDFDTGSNVVDVYVGYLRRKLDARANRRPSRPCAGRDTVSRRSRVTMSARVAVAVTLVLALGVLALSFAAYWRVSASLAADLDRSLLREAEAFAGALAPGVAADADLRAATRAYLGARSQSFSGTYPVLLVHFASGTPAVISNSSLLLETATGNAAALDVADAPGRILDLDLTGRRLPRRDRPRPLLDRRGGRRLRGRAAHRADAEPRHRGARSRCWASGCWSSRSARCVAVLGGAREPAPAHEGRARPRRASLSPHSPSASPTTARTTRSAAWSTRSTRCSTGWRARSASSAASPPTPRTSCARRSR